ncbi:MAG: hypothetical protein F6K30_25375 [Cyanothece sp. SIO2G6]|nr:hypothetical protein [Cyanothece sp. SIO2G6]
MMTQRFSIVAIAAITSIATVSVTYQLLSQPWCLQRQANGQTHHVYKQGRCNTSRISSERPNRLPFLNQIDDSTQRWVQ